MFDQLFSTFRKASESSLQVQNEVFKYWGQQWAAMAPNGVAGPNDPTRNVKTRIMELGVELLHKHRQSLDAAYAAGIEIIEQSFRASDAKSPDDYRRLVDDLWRKVFDTFKAQADSQLDAFQKWSATSVESANNNVHA
jgi:hypothetical protein